MTYSFQLYSARDFQPWADVLAMLAGAGYRQVEGFGGVYADPAGFRAMMDENGLSMPSGHFSIDALETDLDGVFATARTLGIRTIYCPHLAEDQRPADRAGWEAFAARLEAVGERVRAEGLGFGWHNHAFEFAALADGTVPMQVLLDEAPSIEWEADIAWIIRGNGDPADWISRHGSRITAVHVKDIAPQGECADEDGWADVGHGTVDWTALLSQLRASGVDRLYVLEHDKPSDAARFARRSIDWLEGKGE
ncbi:sugar phosphate isomerase/epimerase family protein [Hoeflea ulvae]|uniref:Sugar phosphate isomerase/epimerase n=1 Tax=Hoeflea ulvae TaxID=2983764 RepID=A0ABT3YAM2_9HYPH|nr:sugar phosphate isomerase/epimerase [Hoeflea ulvae]MCY0092931.1 sugar phosphate isomerase/epimerase [Hoeflea ulvae]